MGRAVEEMAGAALQAQAHVNSLRTGCGMRASRSAITSSDLIRPSSRLAPVVLERLRHRRLLEEVWREVEPALVDRDEQPVDQRLALNPLGTELKSIGGEEAVRLYVASPILGRRPPIGCGVGCAVPG